MRIDRVLAAGAAAMLLAATAQAGHFQGWYVGLEGGGGWIDDTDARAEISPVAGPFTPFDTGRAEFDQGLAAFASAGYAFANNWRIEGEFGYRKNDVAVRWTIFDNLLNLRGDVEEYSLMANLLYDVQLTERLALSLGAGAGGDNVRLDTTLTGFPAAFRVADDQWRFAAQALAGLSYALGPRWDLTLTYRYLHLEGPSSAQSFNAFAAPTTLTVDFGDLAKHSVSIGLRFDLTPDREAVPPAPPPPPPPPPPAVKQFLIFFGFDRCDITDEADRVLGEAAAAAKATGGASVRVVGHTDTSGSAAYNQRLSACRANAAKTALVGKGIAEAAISTSGRGETELMVQTGDGVKEPQNRRATVDLQ